MKTPQYIALVGFPCSGKTTLGKALAQKLNYFWIDSDQALEEATGQSPEKIILNQGQAAFRKAEHHWLQKWQPQNSTVLSTGGGLPCFHNNLSLLKTKAWALYINPEYKVLEQRLYQNPAHTLTRIYSPAELKELHQKRELIYQKSDFNFRPVEDVQSNIQMILKQFT